MQAYGWWSLKHHYQCWFHQIKAQGRSSEHITDPSAFPDDEVLLLYSSRLSSLQQKDRSFLTDHKYSHSLARGTHYEMSMHLTVHLIFVIESDWTLSTWIHALNMIIRTQIWHKSTHILFLSWSKYKTYSI